MTLSALVQLYAPLAGLLVMAFWLGLQTQRVSSLENQVKGLQDEEDQSLDQRDRLIRLEVQMEVATKSLESVDRGMQGVQRQLAVLARSSGAIVEFGGAPHS